MEGRVLLDLGTVVDAYYGCRSNKRNTLSSLNFEVNLFDNLSKLHSDIMRGEYEVSPSICFVVTSPKVREVWAAQFRDRVVHHVIFNSINPYWEKRWCADSCATISGRGTLYGAKRMQRHIKSLTNNWNEEGYYLKCDLSNFFNSIDKRIVWDLLLPSLDKDWLREIAYKTLFNNPTESGIYLSSPDLYKKIPKRKRLKSAGVDKGIPIGNLTSQMFANILLNPLDQFIKRELKAAKYIRYVDDFILLSKSKDELKLFRREIDKFLIGLGLNLNPKKTYLHSISRGVSFVGHTIYPHRWVTLKDTTERSIARLLENPDSVDSYISLFNQAENSYNLIDKTLRSTKLTTRVNWEK